MFQNATRPCRSKTRLYQPRIAWGIAALLATALAVGAFAQDAGAQNGEEIPYDEANVFVELNNTDGDLGFHALIDGEAWKRLRILDPDGHIILDVRDKGALLQQGLTELFFESAEPDFGELTPEEFFERFPAGEYEISGVTIEGDQLESEVEFTHIMPAPADNIQISGEDAAEDCDAEPLPEVGTPLVISWDEVTKSHPDIGDPTDSTDIEVVGYQVVVEREEPTLLIYSVELPADVTEIEVPDAFIELGDAFKFEILVTEASGNRTAVESCFEIEE